MKPYQVAGLVPPTMADESLKSHPRIRGDNVAMSHIVVGGIYLASGSQTCQEPLEMLRDYTPGRRNITTKRPYLAENRLPTIIASQTDPSYWVQAMPDRTAGDSSVNRLATNTRWIVLGNTDMRKLKHDETRAATDYWE